ncbi:fluoride efflux transporter CrcB [Neobacillus sp. DY30]|uniref:fluoride efflux transporter CrcB n=1 Tax=Neobacillus sp. DY30 TaxID=3047871 RepID=UPI0024BFD1F0|nr:fluoride efflux transporter CrcB [Neobacillus sp. DY30]WHX98191.1 fluoride efflux transporter CrcB [Neobacillus sp. DY30]
MKVIAVMLGGFFGAITRYGFGEWIQTENGFPLGTLLINLIGCFFLGWFLTFITIRKKIKAELTLLIGTGFAGSFTTFSTFSLETILLFQKGQGVYAVFYILTSIIFGLMMAYFGLKLASINGRKGESI